MALMHERRFHLRTANFLAALTHLSYCFFFLFFAAAVTPRDNSGSNIRQIVAGGKLKFMFWIY